MQPFAGLPTDVATNTARLLSPRWRPGPRRPGRKLPAAEFDLRCRGAHDCRGEGERLRIRRQLFLLQVATLGIVTAGGIAGLSLSWAIGQHPSRQADLLEAQIDSLAHVSFDLVGAIPHTGQYLLSSPVQLNQLIHDDTEGLRQFRQELDARLMEQEMTAMDPQLHRELETVRLLSVQLEQRLQRQRLDLQQAIRHNTATDQTGLLQTIRDPTIGLIRRHSDLISGLHDRLDHRHTQMVNAKQQAVWLGMSSSGAVLLLAWVVGLLLAWRTGDRLLAPLIQLEQLMHKPPQGVDVALQDPIFLRAPAEVANLAGSFRILVLEMKQLLAQLEAQLETDGLTAVGNRRQFDAMLQKEWARALRSGEPLSLLLLDVDHFKLYNDHYGHVAGDRCLQQVAMAMRGQARRVSDVVCRIGGEEFAVLLPATPQAEAVGLAYGIVHAVDELAIEHSSSPVADWVTVSIGVASSIPSGGEIAKTLMERADAALYQRKKSQGRHGVCEA